MAGNDPQHAVHLVVNESFSFPPCDGDITGYKIIGLGNEINISDIDDKGKNLLICTEVDYSLNEWLGHPNRDIWSKKHKQWDSCNFISRDSTLNRLEVESAAVLQAVIVAVLDSHRKGVIHGALDQPENFLLRAGNHVDGHPYFDCYLSHKKESSGPQFGVRDKLTDMSQLDMLIRTHFLKNEVLPYELQDLMSLISRYEMNNWTADDEIILRNHQALWPPLWRIKYWTSFSDHCKTFKSGTAEFLHLTSILRSSFTRFHRNGLWKRVIPHNSPLESVFNFRHYPPNDVQLPTFIRNVNAHYKDWDGAGNRAHLKWKNNSTDIDYIEALIGECFSSSLLPLYRQIRLGGQIF